MVEPLSNSLFDADKLNSFKKLELINIILELQKEKDVIRSEVSNLSSIEKRVIELERSHALYLQYNRRNSVEITGIPEDVEQKDLECQVIKIYDEAEVGVHGRSLNLFDIEACHRIGKKNVVIVRFVNRKFAREGLYKGRDLKGKNIYGNGPVYINDSFCEPFNYIGYSIRKLKKRSLIEGYKIKNGVYHVKKEANDNFIEISHTSDFIKYNIDTSKLE